MGFPVKPCSCSTGFAVQPQPPLTSGIVEAQAQAVDKVLASRPSWRQTSRTRRLDITGHHQVLCRIEFRQPFSSRCVRFRGGTPFLDWQASAAVAEERHEAVNHPCRLPNLAFPDNKYSPPLTSKQMAVPPVAFHVAVEFGFPESPPRPGHDLSKATPVPVPETPMHKNNLSTPRKDQIRAARQVAIVEAIAVSERVEDGANDHLRRGVFAANSGHAVAPLLCRQDVSHEWIPSLVLSF